MSPDPSEEIPHRQLSNEEIVKQLKAVLAEAGPAYKIVQRKRLAVPCRERRCAMSVERIKTKKTRDAVKFELAATIRTMLDEARKKYGPKEWDEDQHRGRDQRPGVLGVTSRGGL